MRKPLREDATVIASECFPLHKKKLHEKQIRKKKAFSFQRIHFSHQSGPSLLPGRKKKNQV
jgi:hypothetical protein